jgi:hypothetical protein
MRARTGIALALAPAVVAVAVAANAASGSTGATIIRFTVPTSAVQAHGSDVAPKGQSPGDGFQESYIPKTAGRLRRQDAVAIGVFRGGGTFLGTLTLSNGQIVYAGTTTNQDDATYAIIGGTGRFATTSGTVTTQSVPGNRVRITIRTRG